MPGKSAASDVRATRAAVRRETAPLLAQCVRTGTCQLLVVLTPFTSWELAGAPVELLPFYVVKLIQLAAILAALAALRHRTGRRRAARIALALLTIVFGTTAVSGMLTGQALSTVA